MSSMVSRPILGPGFSKTTSVGDTVARIDSPWAGRGPLLLAVAIALVAFAFPAETTAQGSKSTPPRSGTATKDKGGAKPGELYGDQGGEKVAPANPRLPNTLLRARLEDTFFKLSNPRIGKTTGRGPKVNALLIDYDVVSKGKIDAGQLVLILRGNDGSQGEAVLGSLGRRDSGTIQLVGRTRHPIPVFRRMADINAPKNAEMYLARIDDRYDPPGKWKVSNSVVMGKMRTTTRARDWTPQEIKRYTKAPPSWKSPNAHPTIGEDVPRLSNTLAHLRYVDPEGRLLGLDYSMGAWDNRKVLSQVTPVFSADQPRSHTARSIAKKGYAVAGAEVNNDKYVCGIRLLFRRIKPDGTLDPKDSYAGNWIGTKPTRVATKLVDDGRRVLGIHIQRAAIIDGFALVVEAKEK